MLENEKNDAYREYFLRKEESLSTDPELNPWFELFEYRIKNNKDPLTGD